MSRVSRNQASLDIGQAIQRETLIEIRNPGLFSDQKITLRDAVMPAKRVLGLLADTEGLLLLDHGDGADEFSLDEF